MSDIANPQEPPVEPSTEHLRIAVRPLPLTRQRAMTQEDVDFDRKWTQLIEQIKDLKNFPRRS